MVICNIFPVCGHRIHKHWMRLQYCAPWCKGTVIKWECGFGSVLTHIVQFGLEAFPNSEFWREVPGLVTDGINFCKAKYEQMSGRSKSYERVDGVDYEWG